ncbi:MAG: hypothetical protein KAX19_14265 [Candidatus Brocadiae bacterium]|nr:hypothetical protein [Candidatus Brocadiia bacterium]
MAYYVRTADETGDITFLYGNWALALPPEWHRFRQVSRIKSGARKVCAGGFPADEPPWEPNVVEGLAFQRTLDRIGIANFRLEERGLARITRLYKGHGFKVELTATGCDLGRKYASWFWRSGEWFKEFKGHWLLILLVAILAYVMGLLTDPIRNALFPSPSSPNSPSSVIQEEFHGN